MKRPVTIIAAMGIALTGIAAAAPASAQEIEQAHFRQGPGQQFQQHQDERFERRGEEGRLGAGGLALVAMACSPEGGTMLETRIDAAAEQLDLSDEQSSLYDDFKTAALSAHTQFAETCAAVIDDRPDDLVEALRTRQAMLTARLDAIDSVLPSFEALYDSLTDAQKLELVKMRADRMHRSDEFRGGQGRWRR